MAIGTGCLFVLIYLTRHEDSLARQCLIIGITGVVIFRAAFLSSMMGRGKESQERMDTRNQAIEDFQANREAVLAKFAKRRADALFKEISGNNGSAKDCAEVDGVVPGDGSDAGLASGGVDLSTVRLERAARLEASGGTVKSFSIDGLASKVFVSEKPGLRLGSMTWDGAVILSRVLPTVAAEITHSRAGLAINRRSVVCELGAGTGLCGVTAALCGARCLITDKAGEVTPIMACTVELNAEGISSAGGSAEVTELSWGDSEACGRALAWSASQCSSSDGFFDLIIGADVVYHVDLVQPLVRTLEELCPLGCPTRILIAYRERGAGAAFLAELKKAGFFVCVYSHGDKKDSWRALYALRLEAEIASGPSAATTDTAGLGAGKKYHVSTEHVILELSRKKMGAE